MAKSITKGKAGERELANKLSPLLGITLSRNLQQTREGGFDLNGLPSMALECKRAAKPAINAWWEQTLRQAERASRVPVLAYRLDRQPWRFVVRLSDLTGREYADNVTASLDLEAFVGWVRHEYADDLV